MRIAFHKIKIWGENCHSTMNIYKLEQYKSVWSLRAAFRRKDQKMCQTLFLLIAAQLELFDNFNKCVMLKVSVFCAPMESRFLNSSFIVNFSKAGLCGCFWTLILVVGIQIVIYHISKNNSHKNNGRSFMGWWRGSFHKEGNILNPTSF